MNSMRSTFSHLFNICNPAYASSIRNHWKESPPNKYTPGTPFYYAHTHIIKLLPRADARQRQNPAYHKTGESNYHYFRILRDKRREFANLRTGDLNAGTRLFREPIDLLSWRTRRYRENWRRLYGGEICHKFVEMWSLLSSIVGAKEFLVNTSIRDYDGAGRGRVIIEHSKLFVKLAYA